MGKVSITLARTVRKAARFGARSWRVHEFLVTAGFDEIALRGSQERS